MSICFSILHYVANGSATGYRNTECFPLELFWHFQSHSDLVSLLLIHEPSVHPTIQSEHQSVDDSNRKYFKCCPFISL